MLTLFTSGVFTLLRYSRLNLSPTQPASTIGAGIGISPEACMLESEMLLLPFISTFPLRR